MNKVVTGLAFNNEVRFYIIDGKELVQTIKEKQGTSPVVTAASGRMAMTTALMGLTLKNEETLTTIIEGNGPIKQMLATANAKGDVKITVSNPNVENTYYHAGKLNVSEAVGNGSLKVIKDLNMAEPYVSQVDLVSGEVIEDFASYFVKSEQIPTSIAFRFLIGEDTNVLNAGVLFVQLLPNASEETLEQLEKDFMNLQSMTTMLKDNSIEDIADLLFKDTGILFEKEVSFKCDCSYDKYLQSLKLLSKEDITEIKNDVTVECVCHFCLSKYDIQTNEI